MNVLDNHEHSQQERFLISRYCKSCEFRFQKITGVRRCLKVIRKQGKGQNKRIVKLKCARYRGTKREYMIWKRGDYVRVEKTVMKKTKVYLIGCDECKKPLRKFMVRVSFMRQAKGLNGRKVWETRKKVVYCPKCYGNGDGGK